MKLRIGLALAIAAALVCGSAMAAPRPAAPSAALARIVTFEMLNAQVAYLESKVGPAMYVDGLTRTYKVDGCKLIVVVDAHSAIRSFDLDLTPRCSFDLNAFLIDRRFGPLTRLTFGEFNDKSPGTFWADCLTLCGNAFDPAVYDHYSGSHADAFVEVSVGAVLITDPAIDAAQVWAKAMTAAEGEDYVTSLKFNCDAKHQPEARAAFRSVLINHITVGFDLDEPPGCEAAGR